jgi:hypothetical protein
MLILKLISGFQAIVTTALSPSLRSLLPLLAQDEGGKRLVSTDYFKKNT